MCYDNSKSCGQITVKCSVLIAGCIDTIGCDRKGIGPVKSLTGCSFGDTVQKKIGRLNKY